MLRCGRHLALRSAGFNTLDVAAAKELGLAVTRVPAYSPYAVAEHAVALLIAQHLPYDQHGIFRKFYTLFYQALAD